MHIAQSTIDHVSVAGAFNEKHLNELIDSASKNVMNKKRYHEE